MRGATIEKIGDRLCLICDYLERDSAKAIGSYQWDPTRKAWSYPLSKLQDIIKMFPHAEHSGTVSELLQQQREETESAKRIEETAKNLAFDCPYLNLYDHQKRGWYQVVNRDAYGLFWEMGTGKTLTILSALDTINPVRTLIVAPLALLKMAWAEDIRKFFPSMPYTIVRGNRSEREAIFKREPPGIWIVNFEAYRVDFDRFMGVHFDVLVVDESSKMKDATSKTTKCLLKHAALIPRRYILSGTPAPNTPFEYWPQIRLLSPSALGDNYYKFRYQYGVQSSWCKYKWIMPPHKQNEMMGRIKEVAQFVQKVDCLDLPEKVFTGLEIPWLERQEEVYRDMLKHYIVEIQQQVIPVTQILSQLMKLRQITSGFILTPEGEVVDIGSNKYDQLMELLDELGEEQVIIWINFKEEARRIEKILGPKCATYYGETPEELRESGIEDFRNGTKRYMVANPASIGHGVTLTNCRYAVYFSMSHSYELYVQSRDRIHRIGQKNKCQYFHLCVEDSIDREIFDAVQAKENLSERLLNLLK